MAQKYKTQWFGQISSERFNRLGREFFWVCSGQAAGMLGGVVGVRVITGVLSPGAYGELALGMTAVTLINQILMGPLGNTSMRFFASAREVDEFLSFLDALRELLVWATGVILIMVCMICLGLLLTGKFNWLWLSVAAFGFAMLSGYNHVLDGIQNAARQRAIVAWHHALDSWCHFIGAVALIVYLGANSRIAMLGYMLASALVLLSRIWFFKQKLLGPNYTTSVEIIETQRWREQMLVYAWPFASWGIFTWARMVSDRWALQMFSSTQEVGLYTVLFHLGYYPLRIITGLIVQLVAPVFYQRAGDASDTSRMRKVHDLNSRLTLVALIFSVIAAFIAAAFHNLVFRMLVDPQYHSVSWLLPGMVLSGGLFASGQFASISLMSNTDTRSLLAPKIGTALLGVLLNLAGAAWFGVIGVVGASLIFSVGHFLWVWFLVKLQHDQLIKIDSIVSKTQKIY